MWYGGGLQQLSYARGESRFSDHRPVSSVFWAEIESAPNRLRKSMSCSSSRIEVEELLPYAHGYTELCFFWKWALLSTLTMGNALFSNSICICWYDLSTIILTVNIVLIPSGSVCDAPWVNLFIETQPEEWWRRCFAHYTRKVRALFSLIPTYCILVISCLILSPHVFIRCRYLQIWTANFKGQSSRVTTTAIFLRNGFRFYLFFMLQDYDEDSLFVKT